MLDLWIIPRRRTIFAVAFAVVASSLAGPSRGAEASTSSSYGRSALETVVNALNPQVGKLDARVGNLRERLRELPPLSIGRHGEQIGYHSPFFDSADARREIRIDLGSRQPVDTIALVPVSAVFQGETIAGYGFPRRFEVETASEPSFADATLIFSAATADFPSPGSFPLVWRFPEHNARFVRVTVLRHWQRADGRYLTALGELVALHGNRILSVGAAVTAPTVDSLPTWSSSNLVDGQTDLGLPVSREPSTFNGFRSDGSLTPNATKWIELDIGRLVQLDSIRLIPAHPFDAPNRHGHGFPVRFRLTVAAEKNGAGFEVIADHRELRFPNPGDNPVILPASGLSGRFVRLEVEELWHASGRKFALALAELQVYADGKNVALGGKISVSDELVNETGVWSPRFLIDGFSSENRLIEYDQWLLGLDERRRVEQELAEVAVETRRERERTTVEIFAIAVGMLVLVLAAVPFSVLRRRRQLAAQRASLQARIARDLHDDIGSRLGGMRLISEALMHEQNLPAPAHDDMVFMHRAIRDALDAMRDIVWLLDGERSTSRQLTAHMRQVAVETLGRIELRFELSSNGPDVPLAVDVRRHVLFAFREVLGNVLKHANPSLVSVTFESDRTRFRFVVHDNGRGFDPEAALVGHGLANLRHRAAELGGRFCIQSAEGKGTQIEFEASLGRPTKSST